jgi:hypothetical protein
LYLNGKGIIVTTVITKQVLGFKFLIAELTITIQNNNPPAWIHILKHL